MDGNTLLGSGNLANGVATFTTSTLSAGATPHAITAVYRGNANFKTATSKVLNETVRQVQSSVVVKPASLPLARL